MAHTISASAGKVTVETDTTIYGLLSLPVEEKGPYWKPRSFVADVSIQKKQVPGLTHSNLDPKQGRLRLNTADVLAIEMALAGGA
jgi:hypothetical protein